MAEGKQTIRQPNLESMITEAKAVFQLGGMIREAQRMGDYATARTLVQYMPDSAQEIYRDNISQAEEARQGYDAGMENPHGLNIPQSTQGLYQIIGENLLKGNLPVAEAYMQHLDERDPARGVLYGWMAIMANRLLMPEGGPEGPIDGNGYNQILLNRIDFYNRMGTDYMERVSQNIGRANGR